MAGRKWAGRPGVQDACGAEQQGSVPGPAAVEPSRGEREKRRIGARRSRRGGRPPQEVGGRRSSVAGVAAARARGQATGPAGRTRLRRHGGEGVLAYEVSRADGHPHRKSSLGGDEGPQLHASERRMVCGIMVVIVFGRPFR